MPLEDKHLAAAYPTMAQPSAPTAASSAKAAPSTQDATSSDAALRAAYPSMFPAEPPAVAAPTAPAEKQPAVATPSAPPPEAPAPEAAPSEVAELAKLVDGLPPERAQKLVEWHAGVRAAEKKAADAEYVSWSTATRADAEIGGGNLTESLDIAKGVLKDYASEDLRQLLTKTPLGNHPEVVRLLARVGKALRNRRT